MRSVTEQIMDQYLQQGYDDWLDSGHEGSYEDYMEWRWDRAHA